MALPATVDPSRQLLDYSVSHQIDLSRYAGSVVRDIIGLLNDADREILDKIAKRGEDGTFTTKRLEALFREIGQMNYDAHVQAGKQMSQEMRGFAEHESEASAMMLDKQTLGHFNIVQINADQLTAIVDKTPITVGPDRSLLLEEIFSSLADGKEEAIRGAIRLGQVEGEGIPEMVRRLRGTRAARFTDGVLETTRRHAATMVRTITNSVSNKAVQLTYQRNNDVVKGWQFLSTLDGRTSLICRSLSGSTWPLGQGPIPPRHPNCRSFQLPILPTWKELGIDLEELPPTMRASKDGLVKADISMDEWMRTQSHDEIKDMLGATRAQLFIDGKLKVDRFADNAGVVYDLKELKARNEAVFKRVFGS